MAMFAGSGSQIDLRLNAPLQHLSSSFSKKESTIGQAFERKTATFVLWTYPNEAC